MKTVEEQKKSPKHRNVEDFFEDMIWNHGYVDFKEEETLDFRNQKIIYDCTWLDDDTFVFQFGDGDFTDSEGFDYFIHFEYHVYDDEWVVEIWWEDNSISIDELDKSDADEFITEQEIAEVTEFAKQFVERDLGIDRDE